MIQPPAWSLDNSRPCGGKMRAMEIIDDLVAEEGRIESILSQLDDGGWATPSLCAGWSICDVMLHLALTEETAAATVRQPVTERTRATEPRGVDDAVGRAVDAERAGPDAVFERWRRACDSFVEGLRQADPDSLVEWVAGTMKPATLATTRLAEHWAHGLDIAIPLGAHFPDTNRLRHVAWLGHRSLPYAFTLAGQGPQPVYCELLPPDGGPIWTFGPPDAPSSIRGEGGAFCRVGAQRLAPAESGLTTAGPYGDAALGVLRNYAA
jgi:uncharacterized protein (TIGR03084 family)